MLCIPLPTISILFISNHTSVDKDLIKQKIASAFENFKNSIRHHTDINVKRADDGWSVAEVADHIVKSTNVHLGGTTKTNRPYDQHAEGIRDLFLNFQTKFPAAPNLRLPISFLNFFSSAAVRVGAISINVISLKPFAKRYSAS